MVKTLHRPAGHSPGRFLSRTGVRAASRRLAGRRGVAERGQTLVEAAVALPLLVLVALTLVQFSLVVHTHLVLTGAVQEGARVAATERRTLDDGRMQAEAMVRAGLGQRALEVNVTAQAEGNDVVVRATARLPLLIPGLTDTSLPLRVQARLLKEQFHGGRR